MTNTTNATEKLFTIRATVSRRMRGNSPEEAMALVRAELEDVVDARTLVMEVVDVEVPGTTGTCHNCLRFVVLEAGSYVYRDVAGGRYCPSGERHVV